jgi:hypothetical protein
MAYDEGRAQVLRDALAGHDFREQRMFGGLCFLLHGHMICGVHRGGAMFRVGKDGYATALAIEGVGPMLMTGRPMASMVDCDNAALGDDTRRAQLLALALATVLALPPKVAKAKKH